jgi:GNAT superfamily N-acetyltransferase
MKKRTLLLLQSLFILFFTVACIALFFYLFPYRRPNFSFHHTKKIPSHHSQIIRHYLNTEYETASKYLDDPEIIHFYILDPTKEILISYFHMTAFEEDNNEYYIYYLFTHPFYRKKGYAKKLLQYGLYHCQYTYYIYKLKALTSLTNTSSFKTFSSLGFTTSFADDAIIFKKNLLLP